MRAISMPFPWTNTKKRAQGDDLDHELARRISEGERLALELLVDRHLAPLYKYLARRLGPGHEQTASDVALATFYHAFRRMKPYAEGTARVPMRLWLIRLANRQLARERPLPRQGESALESDDLKALRHALSALPPRQQSAVALALFEGMSAAEIAGALVTSQARAMGLLRSALKRIGRKLHLEEAPA